MSNDGYYGHFVELQWSTSPWSSEQHAVVICPWNCSAPFVVGATCGGHLSSMGRIRLLLTKIRHVGKLLLVLVSLATTDPVFVARVEPKVYRYIYSVAWAWIHLHRTVPP